MFRLYFIYGAPHRAQRPLQAWGRCKQTHRQFRYSPQNKAYFSRNFQKFSAIRALRYFGVCAPRRIKFRLSKTAKKVLLRRRKIFERAKGKKFQTMKISDLGKKIFIFPIRVYQKIISPVLHLIPCSGCRFCPTCSEYTIQAIKKFGVLKGCLQGFCRILRCQPLCKGGFDEVPEKFQFTKLFSQNAPDSKKGVDEKPKSNHKD